MISPLDVQLDCDDRTMVQPDVVIVCDRDKIDRQMHIRGSGFGHRSAVKVHPEEGHSHQAEQVHERGRPGVLDD